MKKLTGLAYLLEHAEFASKESREKTEARIKPLLDAANKLSELDWRPKHQVSLAVYAIDGDANTRISLGMEAGE